jgi:hypothetical protein
MGIRVSADHLNRVFDSEVGELYRKIGREKLGVEILSPAYFGVRHVNLRGNKKIDTPADMAGVKLRMPGGESWQFLGASLGADPVAIAYAELYTALQTGTVDGHSFYFRERHGTWRIELDLEPSGQFAERVVDVRDGEFVTEPEPILEGTVIAKGVDSQLGTTPVDHLAFIVTTVRDHLWARECDHAGALLFCPKCGQRR